MAKMHVAQKITISRPKEDVFDYVRHLKNQNEYSVWNLRDPSRHVDYVGTDGNEGFVYSWDSKDKYVGAGTQQITRIVDNERIESELQFKRPMKNIGKAAVVLSAVSEQETEVEWAFESPMKFPFSLFKGMFEKSLGKDLQQNLHNLKQKLEQTR